ncbi:MAG: hypothetical protein HQL05_05475 [Nitrospirae bacterium]|uniref:Magnetosome protein Man1 n=2 Tax=Nitrospirota TaxID=40117 RepID=A0A142BU05_9BACT|nr:hypothetical protein [Candidatus Magnetobacterium casensis]AMP41593.1 magnetosome protein Man1 [uncultured Nitrospirota bacterium]MBF0337263.1 hypothetical protein [Nitrospirota bacterium]
MTPKDIMSSGVDVLNETWLYSVASVEYSGLVSYSYLRRGVDLTGSSWDYVADRSVKYVANPVVQSFKYVADPVVRSWNYVATPVADSVKYVVAPVSYVGQWFKKLGPLFTCKNAERDEKLTAIEARLQKIEERLANIEKHGVVVASDITVIKKEVDEYKKALLRGVLQENIMLREET